MLVSSMINICVQSYLAHSSTIPAEIFCQDDGGFPMAWISLHHGSVRREPYGTLARNLQNLTSRHHRRRREKEVSSHYFFTNDRAKNMLFWYSPIAPGLKFQNLQPVREPDNSDPEHQQPTKTRSTK
jgi:hypothetical protein